MAPPPPGSAQWLPEPPAPVGVYSKSVDSAELQKSLTWNAGSAPAVRLYPPEVEENPDAGRKGPSPFDASTPGKGNPPRVEEGVESKEPPTAPVGIPKFVRAYDKVANGRRPSLDDGLDWLRSNGFKTVLYLHDTGAFDTADRKQVESRGMRFVALEVSPQILSKKIIDEFNRIVADSEGVPLFVYDKDGSLSGAMWYLHFRLIQQASDDVARTRARPMGLQEDGADHGMWKATQKFLSER